MLHSRGDTINTHTHTLNVQDCNMIQSSYTHLIDRYDFVLRYKRVLDDPKVFSISLTMLLLWLLLLLLNCRFFCYFWCPIAILFCLVFRVCGIMNYWKVDKYFLATIVAHETKSRNLKNKPEGPFSHNKTFLTFEWL